MVYYTGVRVKDGVPVERAVVHDLLVNVLCFYVVWRFGIGGGGVGRVYRSFQEKAVRVCRVERTGDKKGDGGMIICVVRGNLGRCVSVVCGVVARLGG